jgi:hypothetical protein
MANAIKWSALGTYTTAIAGADVAPTLKNLANAALKIGNEIDNATTARNMYADFDLKCKFGTAPSAGGYVALYLVQAVDGTNYADGSDAITPAATALVGTFPVRAVTDAQRVSLRHVLLPATKFKPLVVNLSGQAMTNTDDENVLSYRPYNEEVQ